MSARSIVWTGVAAVWSVTATVATRGQEDPDRGLAPELRAAMARASAPEALTELERVAADVESWLARVREAFLGGAAPSSGGSLDALRVPVVGFLGRSPEGARAPGAAQRAPLEQRLAAWRGEFAEVARLELELVELNGVAAGAGEPARWEADVRAVALGRAGEARIQHTALWRLDVERRDGVVVVVAVRPQERAVVPLVGGPAPPFVDLGAARYQDPAWYETHVAPGLDTWRARIPANVAPGMLGHHGVAVGDVDGDGLEDVYVCRPGGLPNQLLRHLPDHRVVDCAAAFEVDLLDHTSSALLADFDGDGTNDLVTATASGLAFFANVERRRFERKLLVERSLATSLAAADVDGDGDLDLYVCSYLSPYERDGLPVPYHDANNGEANQLLRNEGGFAFVDATAELGLGVNNRRFTLAAAFEDLDEDGDQDLYVANDFGRNNLYRNDGGRFVDVAAELGALDISAGMGVTFGDADGDGWMDVYVTNMHSAPGARLTGRGGLLMDEDRRAAAMRDHARGNTLLRNDGGRRFVDVSEASGAAFGRWGWGALFIDFDGDGALDLFAPNGFVSGPREDDLDGYFWREVVLRSPPEPGPPGEAYALGWRSINRLVRQGWSWNGRERNVALSNVGAGRFVDVSAVMGLDLADDTRAAARVDWDHDGDLDLWVTNRNGPMVRLLENRLETGASWVGFELETGDPRRTAVGARVEVVASDGGRRAATVRTGEGYLAQSSARLHFGLGAAEVRDVRVRWPWGAVQTLGPVARGALHRVRPDVGVVASRPFEVAVALAPAPPGGAPPPAYGVTDALHRVVPTHPLPLPRFGVETFDGRVLSLLGAPRSGAGAPADGAPMVLVLCAARDEATRASLARLAGGAEELAAHGLRQVIALELEAAADVRAEVAAAWESSGWPFPRALISDEGAQVAACAVAALVDGASALRSPTAMLFDGAGRCVAVHAGALDVARLAADAALVDLAPEARLAAAVPFAGRWLGPAPASPLDDVAARLSAHGLARAAAELATAKIEQRAFSPAGFEFDLGEARLRQGRFEDAARHFRRALELEPTHVKAAQGLAAVLHQLGQLDAAHDAYRAALRLAPGEPAMRFGLGLVSIARRDLEAARAELAALRALSSPLASELEKALQAAGGK